jgi:hypothetical protein
MIDTPQPQRTFRGACADLVGDGARACAAAQPQQTLAPILLGSLADT